MYFKRLSVNKSLINGLSGASASGLTAGIVGPIDGIRKVKAVNPIRSIDFIVFEIVQKHGIRGLWKGVGTATVEVVMSRFFSFTVASEIKGTVRRSSNLPEFLTNMMAGVSGGAATAVATTPVGIFKTRLQTQGWIPHERAGQPTTIPKIANQIYADHGLKGFYSGYSSRAMKSIVGFAPFYMTYEWLIECMPVDKTDSLYTKAAKWGIQGGVSTMASDLFAYPMSVAQAHMQGKVHNTALENITGKKGVSYKTGRHNVTIITTLARQGWESGGVKSAVSNIYPGFGPRCVSTSLGGVMWGVIYGKAKSVFSRWETWE